MLEVTWLVVDKTETRKYPVTGFQDISWSQLLLWTVQRSVKQRVTLISFSPVGGTCENHLRQGNYDIHQLRREQRGGRE